MKKLICLLAVLLAAAPALADVDISCSAVVDGNTAVITVSYDATTETSNVRAFALDITLQGEANIIDVNCVNGDYYIYPGSIDIDSQGNVQDFGSCLCDSGYPGTLPGLDTNGVTVEMGSLYAEGEPAPAKSGTLLELTIQGCGDVNVVLAENAVRGGVVMEDPDETPTVNLTGCTASLASCAPPECVKSTAPFYADWVALGKPDCWCYPRNCKGDADGQIQYGLFWVYTNDLNILKNAFAQNPLPPGGECADFARDIQFGLFRVYTNDLAILKNNFAQSGVTECDMTYYNFWIEP